MIRRLSYMTFRLGSTRLFSFDRAKLCNQSKSGTRLGLGPLAVVFFCISFLCRRIHLPISSFFWLPPPEQFEPLVNFNRYSCLFFCYFFFFGFLLELYQTIYIYPSNPSIHPPHRIVLHISYHTCIPTTPHIQFDHPCMYSYILFLPPVYIFLAIPPGDTSV